MTVWYTLDPSTKAPVAVGGGVVAALLAMANPERVVAKTFLHGLEVSTVFLSLDHSFGSGPPILFETLVFGTGNSHWIDDGRRYHTWDEAMAGHERFVAMIDYEIKHWKSPTSRNVREGRFLARRAKRAACS